MELDPLFLSRIQFAFTITFHIIFPTISIGLGMFLTLIEGLWLWTKNDIYLRIYRFWVVIFGMGFGVGVVTGIVLSFQFGTNFATFAKLAGPVIGPLIGLEVLTAFFLEAGFLGIMLFGMKRVTPRVHFIATFMVALGTTISASWIMAANSWMQTPVGIEVVDGHYVVTSWLDVIFNPSYLHRLPHMLLAAYITASLLVAGVGGWYLLKGVHQEFARKTLSIGTGLLSVFIALQMYIGDVTALKMIPYQPSKFQALEGYWETTRSAPYLLFIIPDQEAQTNHVQVGIPYLGSLFITHTLDGPVPGLKETPRELQPPMGPVFYSFRLMFLLGLTMFTLACISIILRWRGRLFTSRRFHKFVVVLSPLGVVATVAGWYTAEIGRQPWTIFGYLKTADSVSPVSGASVLTSLVLFCVVYSIFMVAFLSFTFRQIKNGPEPSPQGSTTGGISTPVPVEETSTRGEQP
ncbi:cytochrome ubiquinol oxidase subunit I [Pseudomonas aeruginosa]|uniref:cytochrome ubiquinol oxidase subunit I n=1 Tax=Pseudomonas aeruginosa TaxID=287 RepID=UPI0034D1955D